MAPIGEPDLGRPEAHRRDNQGSGVRAGGEPSPVGRPISRAHQGNGNVLPLGDRRCPVRIGIGTHDDVCDAEGKGIDRRAGGSGQHLAEKRNEVRLGAIRLPGLRRGFGSQRYVGSNDRQQKHASSME